MTSRMGRSVRLFLADGTSSGLITAEIMNWTGHVLAGRRAGLPAFLKRPELDRTGVYFLIGSDPDDPDLDRLYIGESDNVAKRLFQHGKDSGKDFWERTCVVTSKDQNITKAHARYLEARLIAIANAAGVANVVNGTAPPVAPLPEADVSDMEFFIEQLRLILPVLGFDFLREARPPKPTDGGKADVAQTGDSPLFELSSKKHDLRAEGREIAGEFVVLAGSAAAPTWTGQAQHSYEKQHANLMKLGKLVPGEDGKLRFTDDVPFKSPSAASAVILGRPDNGRLSWRVSETGATYTAWQETQLNHAAMEDELDGSGEVG